MSTTTSSAAQSVAAIVLGASLLGAVAALQPLYTSLALLFVVVAAWPITAFLTKPTQIAMVWLLLLLNVLDVLRWAQSEPILGVFGPARLPLTTLAIGALIVSRGGQLLAEQSLQAAMPGLAYAIWALVVSPWSSDPSDSAMRAVWMAMILVGISGTLALWDDPLELWERWLLGLSRTGLVLGTFAMLTILAGFSWTMNVRYVAGQELAGYRAFFLNPNALGCLGTVTVAASLAWLRSRIGKDRPLMVYAAIGVGALCTVSSASRGAAIGMFLAGGLYLFVEGRQRQALLRRLLTGAATVSILIVAVFASDAGDTILGRLTGTDEQVEEGGEGRLAVWANFVAALVDHPITGIGFCQAANERVSANLNAGVSERAHSMLIEFGTTAGIPGLLLFSWALIGAFAGVRSRFGKELSPSIGVMVLGLLPLCVFEARGSPGSDATWPIWFVVMFGRSLAAHWPAAGDRLAARAAARAEVRSG